jgi:hypothetical protein
MFRVVEADPRRRTDRSRLVLACARYAESNVAAARRCIDAALTRAEVTLRRFTVRRDPDVQRWQAEMRQRLADGSIWAEVESQPDPEIILEQWRSAAAT